MRTTSELENIARLCHLFLTYYEHYSKRDTTENLIHLLHAAAEPEQDEPPTLGVSVSDGIAAKDRPG